MRFFVILYAFFLGAQLSLLSRYKLIIVMLTSNGITELTQPDRRHKFGNFEDLGTVWLFLKSGLVLDCADQQRIVAQYEVLFKNTN